MQEIGWEAWGVEPDPGAVDIARANGCTHILQGSLEDFEFEAGSIDQVTLWDSLEHTFSPVSILRKVKTLLRPGGLIYI
jgi:2-polyprenyl-3-methyl-5-hydroxy-6-metoxy-1,4-benzoquinol methylase